jgi:hypothetical protein
MKLLSMDFSYATSLIDVIKTVNQCKALYTVNASHLPSQSDVIALLLDKLPPNLSIKVSLGLSSFADAQNEPQQSFKNVSSVLQDIMSSRDNVLWLHVANGSNSSDTNLLGLNASTSAAPRSNYADLSLVPASDADKCRALAVIAPEDPCPVHGGAHPVKHCPYVQSTSSQDSFEAEASATMAKLTASMANLMAAMQRM